MASFLGRETDIKSSKLYQNFSAIPLSFAFLVTGVILDYLTASYGFRKYSGYDIELNPLARYSFKQWGMLLHLVLIGFVLFLLFRLMPTKGNKSFGANIARGAVLLALVFFWACACLNLVALTIG